MSELDALLVRLEALRPERVELGLERVRAAAERLGSPHQRERRRWVLVAGTNGKGSTATFLAAILRAHGLRTGLFTSPHLESVHERIQVDGRCIEDAALVASLRPVLALAEGGEVPVTYFEALTLAAMVHFGRVRADVGVLEVGLGGRLDATNIVEPAVSVITGVGRDHTRVLGETLQAIAWEKGGVVREGVPLVTGLPDDLLAAAVRGRGAPSPVFRLGEHMGGAMRGGELSVWDLDLAIDGVRPRLRAAYQADNAALGVRAARALCPDLSEAAVRRGLEAAFIPGRLERIDTSTATVLLDGAHNADGAARLAEALRAELDAGAIRRPLVAVVAMLRRRRPAAVVAPLAPVIDAWVPSRGDPVERYATVEDIADAVEQSGGAEVLPPSPLDGAVEAALARAEGGTVVVVGSLYAVGAVRGAVLARRVTAG